LTVLGRKHIDSIREKERKRERKRGRDREGETEREKGKKRESERYRKLIGSKLHHSTSERGIV
jgi:hypothetical protein